MDISEIAFAMRRWRFRETINIERSALPLNVHSRARLPVTQRKLSGSLTLIWIAAAVIVACALLSACSAEPTDYLSWTKADWDKASDAQKTAAAEAVLETFKTSLGDDVVSDETAATVDEMVDTIDQYYKADDTGTLQDLVDLTLPFIG